MTLAELITKSPFTKYLVRPNNNPARNLKVVGYASQFTHKLPVLFLTSRNNWVHSNRLTWWNLRKVNQIRGPGKSPFAKTLLQTPSVNGCQRARGRRFRFTICTTFVRQYHTKPATPFSFFASPSFSSVPHKWIFEGLVWWSQILWSSEPISIEYQSGWNSRIPLGSKVGPLEVDGSLSNLWVLFLVKVKTTELIYLSTQTNVHFETTIPNLYLDTTSIVLIDSELSNACGRKSIEFPGYPLTRNKHHPPYPP